MSSNKSYSEKYADIRKTFEEFGLNKRLDADISAWMEAGAPYTNDAEFGQRAGVVMGHLIGSAVSTAVGLLVAKKLDSNDDIRDLTREILESTLSEESLEKLKAQIVHEMKMQVFYKKQ